MKENIEKPITVIRQEFIEKLTDDINNCGLPLFIIESILKDIYLEVKTMSQRQYEVDKSQYENMLRADSANEIDSKDK